MADGGRAARYVAIITDGNGRWAAERGLPVIEGHSAVVARCTPRSSTMKSIVTSCACG